MMPLARQFWRPRYVRVVGIMGSQMGKTDTVCNIMGHRLDINPAPLLYIGPTKDFVQDTWEPRFMAMVDSVDSLRAKKRQVKREKKTLKQVAGVKVRFGWAGSATQLAGEPAAKVFVDERDRMDDDVGGEGDPVEMADGRHQTYPDGQTGVFSTPTIGTVDTYIHEETGLEHWKPSDNLGSASWKLWQEGTRHEWAWECPDCERYFVPRFRHLVWPEGVKADEVTADNVGVACIHCGSIIPQSKKAAMNATGLPLAPGQWVDDAGEIQGEPPKSDTWSLWVSGLASPWRDWDVMARRWLVAVESGDPERIQGVLNIQFGELYSASNEAPPWESVAERRGHYKMGDVPCDDPLGIVMGVDVQLNRLVYVVRMFGPMMDSWLLEHGEVYSVHGGTDAIDVWNTLAAFRRKIYGDRQIDRCFVDSRYRTAQVYDFCRSHRGWAYPIVGSERIDKPLAPKKVDVTSAGRLLRGGLTRWTLNTDFFKRWIHEQLERDQELPGQWHLPADATDDYCAQIVAEARVVKPSGAATWVRIRKDNHYLDCEMMSIAAAYSLQFHIKAQAGQAEDSQVVRGGIAREDKAEPVRLRPSGGGSGSNWFRRR